MMGGVGSGRRSARAVRDQHGRLLDPESPEALQQMAVTWPKQRLGEASRALNVDAKIAELVALEEAQTLRKTLPRSQHAHELGNVELRGFEPLTSCMPCKRSTS